MKIDTSKIEGYEEMSAEDKVKALESYEAEEKPTPVDNNSDRLKKALDKATSEAAEYKRQLRAKQTEAEIAESERASAEAAMKAELEELRKEKAISNYKAKYMSIGYAEELAETSAEALMRGETETVFSDLKTFINNKIKEIESSTLTKQPSLTNGKPITGKTVEEQEMAKLRKQFGL